MIKTSILYPNKPDARFDIQFYLETHIPVALEIFNAPQATKAFQLFADWPPL